MPTKHLDYVLDRDLSKAQAKQLIDIASPVLQEAINYATNAYERCRLSDKGSKNEAFPVIALYLHIIQMTDSIEVLVSNCCGSPTIPLLRSLFEAKLSIEYILDRRTKKRAVAWLVRKQIDQIEFYERYLPYHERGKEYREAYESDFVGRISELPSMPEAGKIIEKIKDEMNKPPYKEIYREFMTLKGNKKRAPEWYSIHNGPRNLKKLAQTMHYGLVYEHLYSSWSKVTHAADVSHLTLPMEDGTQILGPVRHALSLVNVSTTTLSFLLDTTRIVLREYRSGELVSFHRWLLNDVMDKYSALIEFDVGYLHWHYNKFVKDKFSSL